MEMAHSTSAHHCFINYARSMPLSTVICTHWSTAYYPLRVYTKLLTLLKELCQQHQPTTTTTRVHGNEQADRLAKHGAGQQQENPV
jgi:hypothetical protein